MEIDLSKSIKANGRLAEAPDLLSIIALQFREFQLSSIGQGQISGFHSFPINYFQSNWLECNWQGFFVFSKFFSKLDCLSSMITFQICDVFNQSVLSSRYSAFLLHFRLLCISGYKYLSRYWDSNVLAPKKRIRKLGIVFNCCIQCIHCIATVYQLCVLRPHQTL